MTPSGLKPNGLERRADIAPAAIRQPAGFSEKVKKVSTVGEGDLDRTVFRNAS